MRLALTSPGGFSFLGTVHSHGWCRLEPFRWREDTLTLETTVRAAAGRALRIRMRPRGRCIAADVDGALPVDREAARAAVRRIFNLDLDLRPFHARMWRDPEYAWIARADGGRLLRAPSAFEDLLKLILTTNCTWAFTRNMTRRLVQAAGCPGPDGVRAFPTPAAVAALPERTLRNEVKVGYRATSLLGLADSIASGELDPEAWQTDPRPTSELYKTLLGLPGVGPYVAENMLRLMGRPHGLALDSAVRGWYYRRYHGGRRVKDSTIARRYRKFGEFGGNVIWCDMVRKPTERE